MSTWRIVSFIRINVSLWCNTHSCTLHSYVYCIKTEFLFKYGFNTFTFRLQFMIFENCWNIRIYWLFWRKYFLLCIPSASCLFFLDEVLFVHFTIFFPISSIKMHQNEFGMHIAENKITEFFWGKGKLLQ